MWNAGHGTGQNDLQEKQRKYNDESKMICFVCLVYSYYYCFVFLCSTFLFTRSLFSLILKGLVIPSLALWGLFSAKVSRKIRGSERVWCGGGCYLGLFAAENGVESHSPGQKNRVTFQSPMVCKILWRCLKGHQNKKTFYRKGIAGRDAWNWTVGPPIWRHIHKYLWPFLFFPWIFKLLVMVELRFSGASHLGKVSPWTVMVYLKCSNG